MGSNHTLLFFSLSFPFPSPSKNKIYIFKKNRLGESVLWGEQVTTGLGLVESKEFFNVITPTPMPQFPSLYNGA